MFRHYRVILRELEINTLLSYNILQMQVLVIQFIIYVSRRLCAITLIIVAEISVL